jgi:hypothetical protein
MRLGLMLVINSCFGKFGAGNRIWQAAKTEFQKKPAPISLARRWP